MALCIFHTKGFWRFCYSVLPCIADLRFVTISNLAYMPARGNSFSQLHHYIFTYSSAGSCKRLRQKLRLSGVLTAQCLSIDVKENASIRLATPGSWSRSILTQTHLLILSAERLPQPCAEPRDGRQPRCRVYWPDSSTAHDTWFTSLFSTVAASWSIPDYARSVRKF